MSLGPQKYRGLKSYSYAFLRYTDATQRSNQLFSSSIYTDSSIPEW
jgi:hypothetical protein